MLDQYEAADADGFGCANQFFSSKAGWVEVGGIEIAIPEIDNKCFPYVPESYDAEATYGVVIWLDCPGRCSRPNGLRSIGPTPPRARRRR